VKGVQDAPPDTPRDCRLRQPDPMELVDRYDAGLADCQVGDPPVQPVAPVWLRLVSICATFVDHTRSVAARALRV
jgi:hypothetical protein